MLVDTEASKYIKRLEIDYHNSQIRVKELEHNLVDWNRSQLSDRGIIAKLQKRIAWYEQEMKEVNALVDQIKFLAQKEAE